MRFKVGKIVNGEKTDYDIIEANNHKEALEKVLYDSRLYCECIKEKYVGSVLMIENGSPSVNVPFHSGKEAEKILLDICKKRLSHPDKYTPEDIDKILERGCEETKTGLAVISWFCEDYL